MIGLPCRSVDVSILSPADIVVGSDLIFALEGIRPLVISITDIVQKSLKSGKKEVVKTLLYVLNV